MHTCVACCAGKRVVHLSDELLGQEVFQVRPKVPRIQDQLLLQLALHGYIVHSVGMRSIMCWEGGSARGRTSRLALVRAMSVLAPALGGY